MENGIASKVLKFADDIEVFNVINGEDDQDVLQSDLYKLVEWLATWQMRFNFDKCKIMNMNRVNHKTMYEMGGQEIAHIDREQDLSVMINSRLSLSGQALDARKKALKMPGVINRNVVYKNAKVITKLYCAFVRPHLLWISNCL